MRRLVALYGFAYGCLGSVAALAWHAAAVLGYPVLPNSVWVVEAIFLVHGCTVVITFHRSPTRRPWDPVLSVTVKRIRAAKLLLGLAVAYFSAYVGMFLFSEIRADATLCARAVPLILTSFALLNTIYVSLHWGLRPENILSAKFRSVMSNPARLIGFGQKRNR